MAEGGIPSNTKEWKDFLNPLTRSGEERQATTERIIVGDDNLPSMEVVCSNNPLLANFTEKINLQEQDHEREGQEDTDLTLTGAGEDNQYLRSGSKWTLDILAQYFSLDRVNFYTKEFAMWETVRTVQVQKDQDIQDILVTLGLTTRDEIQENPSMTGLQRLNDTSRLKECSVRTILDSLFRSICCKLESNMKIKISQEISLKRQGLPTNIFDYVFTRNDQAVGIVEAKTPSTMNQKSVAQLVIQLMSLMTMTEDQESTRFGVLTDGFRFLFAYANKNGVFFESKEDDNGEVTVLVHKANKWEDLDSIKIKILNLCHRARDFDFISKSSTQEDNCEDLYTRTFPFGRNV